MDTFYIFILCSMFTIFIYFLYKIEEKYAATLPILKNVTKTELYKLSDTTTTSSVIIAGCVKNCEKYLHIILHKIHELSLGKKTYFIFYENNSTDNSLVLLQNFMINKNGILLSENISIPHKLRTVNIAHGRNRILQHIRDNNLYDSYDYFINMDMDDVNLNLDINSVNKCLSESTFYTKYIIIDYNIFYYT